MGFNGKHATPDGHGITIIPALVQRPQAEQGRDILGVDGQEALQFLDRRVVAPGL
jgi:hypothetical protein